MPDKRKRKRNRKGKGKEKIINSLHPQIAMCLRCSSLALRLSLQSLLHRRWRPAGTWEIDHPPVHPPPPISDHDICAVYTRTPGVLCLAWCLVGTCGTRERRDKDAYTRRDCARCRLAVLSGDVCALTPPQRNADWRMGERERGGGRFLAWPQWPGTDAGCLDIPVWPD